LHWHGDTFDLPDGATLLASTKDYSNQAFAWSDAALALQFHPEVMASKIERWFIGHACELSAPGMPDLGRLRADTARYHAALERSGSALFNEWLGRAGLLTS
ncbi:MAG: glutamine amidotransferase, partial [Burkholderiaceae bacterium]